MAKTKTDSKETPAWVPVNESGAYRRPKPVFYPLRDEQRHLVELSMSNLSRSRDELLELVTHTRGKALERLAALIPPDYADASLEDHGYMGDTLRDLVDQLFSSSPVRGILITGHTGAGKTHALYGIVRYLMARDPGRLVDFYTYTDLMAEIRFESTHDTDRNVWDIVRNTGKLYGGLLIIDDMGSTKGSTFESEKLYGILDARLAACEPIIITTNIEPDHMIETFGERIASRLARFDHVHMGLLDERELDSYIDL